MTAHHNARPGQIYLITGTTSYTSYRMEELTVQGALSGHVDALILGNRFNLYNIAYKLAETTTHYRHLLDSHITLSRAETCYQAVGLLSEFRENDTVTLVSDLLVTFEDESAPEKEIDELFFEGLLQLKRLATHAPVIVSAHPGRQRPHLFRALEKAAAITEGHDTFPIYMPAPRQEIEVLMGHTKLPFTMQYKQERQHFTEMKRGLLLAQDKLRFADMLDRAEFHISACEKAAHPLPHASIMMAVALEQEKALYRLAERDRDRENQIKGLKQDLKAREQRILQLEGRIAALDEDLDRRLAAFRQEMLELKYPVYDLAP